MSISWVLQILDPLCMSAYPFVLSLCSILLKQKDDEVRDVYNSQLVRSRNILLWVFQIICGYRCFRREQIPCSFQLIRSYFEYLFFPKSNAEPVMAFGNRIDIFLGLVRNIINVCNFLLKCRSWYCWWIKTSVFFSQLVCLYYVNLWVSSSEPILWLLKIIDPVLFSACAFTQNYVHL